MARIGSDGIVVARDNLGFAVVDLYTWSALERSSRTCDPTQQSEVNASMFAQFLLSTTECVFTRSWIEIGGVGEEEHESASPVVGGWDVEIEDCSVDRGDEGFVRISKSVIAFLRGRWDNEVRVLEIAL